MKSIFLVLVALAACIIEARADEAPHISASTIHHFLYSVRAGEKLEIVNSSVCLDLGAPCEIVVEQGAKLELTNTDIGSRATIYYQDSINDSVKIVNGTIAAHFKEGLPAHYSISSRQAPYIRNQDKHISNTNLEIFSATVRQDEITEIVNSDLCMASAGDPCLIRVSPHARLSWINSHFGSRTVIGLVDTHLTNIDWANVEFGGEMRSGEKLPAAIPPPPPPPANDDAKIISDLSKRSIAAESTDRGVVIKLPDVYFDFDKASLTREARKNVDYIAEILRNYRSRHLAVEGHTDAIGSDSYNQRLSEERARAVSGALHEEGISSLILTARGFGKTRPIADNATDEGRARNRRVEVVVEKSGGVFVPNSDSLNERSRSAPTHHERIAPRGSDDDSAEITWDKQGLNIKAPDSELHIGEDGIRIRGK